MNSQFNNQVAKIYANNPVDESKAYASLLPATIHSSYDNYGWREFHTATDDMSCFTITSSGYVSFLQLMVKCTRILQIHFNTKTFISETIIVSKYCNQGTSKSSNCHAILWVIDIWKLIQYCNLRILIQAGKINSIEYCSYFQHLHFCTSFQSTQPWLKSIEGLTQIE